MGVRVGEVYRLVGTTSRLRVMHVLGCIGFPECTVEVMRIDEAGLDTGGRYRFPESQFRTEDREEDKAP